jgi:hypothetical protein
LACPARPIGNVGVAPLHDLPAYIQDSPLPCVGRPLGRGSVSSSFRLSRGFHPGVETVALKSRRLNAALGRARAADLGSATRGVPAAPAVDVHCSRTRSISQPRPTSLRRWNTHYPPTGPIVLARWRQDRRAGNGILSEGSPSGEMDHRVIRRVNRLSSCGGDVARYERVTMPGFRVSNGPVIPRTMSTLYVSQIGSCTRAQNLATGATEMSPQ